MAEAILRRREDGSVELRVNGVFVMDDVETSSERALAKTVLATGVHDVLVGGLGLGYTARELLADDSIRSLVVAEIHGEIIDWMRDGTIPGADLLADERLDLRLGDVGDVVAAMPQSALDAILLDVDNGPDFLVYDDNAAVYRPRFLAVCAARLRPGGSVSLWSMDDSPGLREALAKSFDTVTAESLPVTLQGRPENYWILRGTGPKRSR